MSSQCLRCCFKKKYKNVTTCKIVWQVWICKIMCMHKWLSFDLFCTPFWILFLFSDYIWHSWGCHGDANGDKILHPPAARHRGIRLVVHRTQHLPLAGYWTIIHQVSQSYTEIGRHFSCSSCFPNNFRLMLNFNPYHISTLIPGLLPFLLPPPPPQKCLTLGLIQTLHHRRYYCPDNCCLCKCGIIFNL